MTELEIQSYDNVWDAIADTPADSAMLQIKSSLMDQITDMIEASGWTAAEAARKCGLTPPRLAELLQGRISQFSLDALVAISAALGQRVQIGLVAA